MNRQQLLIKILEEQFPDECDIVGPANLRHLANGTTATVRAEHGDYLDLAQALRDLSDVVTFVASAITILQAYRGAQAKRWDVAVAREVVERSVTPPAGVDPAHRETIYRRMLEWLDRDVDTLQPPAMTKGTSSLDEAP